MSEVVAFWEYLKATYPTIKHSIIAEGPIDYWSYTDRINFDLFFDFKLSLRSAKVKFLERRGIDLIIHNIILNILRSLCFGTTLKINIQTSCTL